MKNSDRPSATFKVGAVALVFMIIGYQIALFAGRAARLRIESLRDHPDTVYVVSDSMARRLLSQSSPQPSSMVPDVSGSMPEGRITVRRDACHASPVMKVREESRRVESFRFNPNTVSVADLMRLGFSERQAQSLDAYRQKGGRFRRKSDFARLFVVSDSVYSRLEKYIDIPLVDINKADSAAFDALPGIGGWFASRMVAYREELGGYACKEQLMDIYHFDQEKFDGLKDLIECKPGEGMLDLWHMSAEQLRSHPYVRSWQTARSIVFYREHNPVDRWTVQGLVEAGLISDETGLKLSRCVISPLQP